MAVIDKMCAICSVTSATVALDKCQICYRYYCGDCAYRSSRGQRFCSLNCSEVYLYGDEDEPTSDELELYDE